MVDLGCYHVRGGSHRYVANMIKYMYDDGLYLYNRDFLSVDQQRDVSPYFRLDVFYLSDVRF
jgi:hypothetical protein